jgi:hypothetical protein
MATTYRLGSGDTLAKFRPVIDPIDQYITLCALSFPLATEYTLAGESKMKDRYRERPSQLSIQEVQDRAKRGDVDGIQELGMRYVDQACGPGRSLLHSFAARLHSGLGIRGDDKVAMEHFLLVAHGPYTQNKRAIACSLLCAVSWKRFIVGCVMNGEPGFKGDSGSGSRLDMAFTFAEQSAALGHFSQACAILARFMDGFRMGELDKKGRLRVLRSFWKEYEAFRQATGSQRPAAIRCATCAHQPPGRSFLKECGGPCSRRNCMKPSYCSRKCQVRVRFHTLITSLVDPTP